MFRLSPFHGLSALLCGYIVAVKQLHPDSVPLPPPAPPTLRVKVIKRVDFISETPGCLQHVVEKSCSSDQFLAFPTLSLPSPFPPLPSPLSLHSPSPPLSPQHLPGFLVLLSLVLAIVGVVSYPLLWLVLSGSAVSWTYLRFYQKKEQGSRGDMSEGFAFATFFPECIQ